MPNNPHYLELIKQARKDHLINISEVSDELVKLYKGAAADLAKQAANAPKGLLTERWAKEYAINLSRRAKELESGLYDITYQGLKRSSSLPAAAMNDFWKAVGGQSFRDAFASTPDDVLAQIIGREFYKDKKGLSTRIWGIANEFETDIGYIVNRGLAEKKSAYQLAKDLEQYVKDPAKRSWDWGKVYPNLSGKKIDYNAQRLARTAINHSYWLSNVKTCKQNPFVTAMHWELSSEHEERQVKPFGPDVCDDYAVHDEGLGIGNFKPENLPVPHPQCLCAQWAVIPQSLEEIGAEIGNWMAGGKNARLDEWYAKYGSGYSDLRNTRSTDNNSLKLYDQSGKINNINGEFTGEFIPVTDESYKQLNNICVFNDFRDELLLAAIIDILDSIKDLPVGTEATSAYYLSNMTFGGKNIADKADGAVTMITLDDNYLSIHNHPSGETFSTTDVERFCDNAKCTHLVVVGNNGKTYILSKTAEYNGTAYYEYIMKKRLGFTDYNSMDDFLKEGEKYGVKYYT